MSSVSFVFVRHKLTLLDSKQLHALLTIMYLHLCGHLCGYLKCLLFSQQNTLEEATVLLSEFEAQGNHSLHPTNQPATTSSSTVGSSSTIKTDKHINTVDSNTSSNMDDIDG